MWRALYNDGSEAGGNDSCDADSDDDADGNDSCNADSDAEADGNGNGKDGKLPFQSKISFYIFHCLNQAIQLQSNPDHKHKSTTLNLTYQPT